ncbi:MAG: sodium-extruding oxaloacetate decarboxylase subunit alpha [Euryarchaeota archaeon]|nr:sodium-extruding oxaloacetate decarboxylase subunit alpha [Euryarchaeota archaeon]
MKKVKITDTTLRDAHQSLLATRMRTRDMLPIVEKMDQAGFFSMEIWGGATFDTCIRFLNEDPWERLREIKNRLKNTQAQMLLRGQNLVGYKHYPDDVVEKFVVKAAENGVDIFRIFDALNDVRNMEFAIKVAKRKGAHVQGAICYTISPVHTIEKYVELAKQLVELNCDSLCIKDMAGMISPHDAYEIVKALKKEVNIPVDLHSHCTSGMAPASYYAACNAGVDILDTAFSLFAWGTSQPPVESIVAALKGTPHDTGLDLELLTEIAEYFKDLRKKYASLLDPISERVDTNVIRYQIPGGMISNLISQLKEQNALDKYEEVLKEVPRVRAELGYAPLVTPTSQIIGIQAVLNVLMGERYKVVPREVKDYVKGFYGRPPGPISDEIRKKIIGDEKLITRRPADLIEPQLERMEKEAKQLGLVKKEEDILTYALFPQVAVKFLKGEIKEEPLVELKEKTAPTALPTIPTEFKVEVNGDIYDVKIIQVGQSAVKEIKRAEEVKPKNLEGGVISAMQGTVLKLKVKTGDFVKTGDIIAVLEAMKMQNDVRAPASVVVKEILVNEGQSVSQGDTLMVIK